MQTTLPSGGRTLRLHVAEPALPGSHPALVLLHGAGGNTGFWLDRIAPFLTAQGIALYAPHYFDRTATTRATPAQLADGVHVPEWLAAIRDTLAHIRTRPSVDPNRIALVGISLGAFLSLALAAETPADVRAIVAISGGLAPPYDTLASTQFPPTLILHGDADTTVPVRYAHVLDRILTRLAVPHLTDILPGEGHFFSPAAYMRILAAVSSFLKQNL